MRKADLLALQGELTSRQAATEAAVAATAALRDECARYGDESTALRAEVRAAEGKNAELQRERETLATKVRARV